MGALWVWSVMDRYDGAGGRFLWHGISETEFLKEWISLRVWSVSGHVNRYIREHVGIW